jgi:hypothetical protein
MDKGSCLSGSEVKRMVKNRFGYLMTVLLLMLVIEAAHAAGEEALAKESQNPVANIISLPFENNLSFGVGPEDGRVNTLNLKPVYPDGAADSTMQLQVKFLFPKS